jgi:hypothetical protein
MPVNRIVISVFISLLVMLVCYMLSGFKSYNIYFELFFFIALVIALVLNPRKNSGSNVRSLYQKRLNKLAAGLNIFLIGIFLFDSVQQRTLDFFFFLEENPLFLAALSLTIHLREKVDFRTKNIKLGLGLQYVIIEYKEIVEYTIESELLTITLPKEVFKIDLLPTDPVAMSYIQRLIEERMVNQHNSAGV